MGTRPRQEQGPTADREGENPVKTKPRPEARTEDREGENPVKKKPQQEGRGRKRRVGGPQEREGELTKAKRGGGGKKRKPQGWMEGKATNPKERKRAKGQAGGERGGLNRNAPERTPERGGRSGNPTTPTGDRRLVARRTGGETERNGEASQPIQGLAWEGGVATSQEPDP
jgi:hypothetical protein